MCIYEQLLLLRSNYDNNLKETKILHNSDVTLLNKHCIQYLKHVSLAI